MEAPEKIWINPPMDLPKLNGVIDKDGIEYIRKDTLVKYLYEEKGYPITLNGELVHWDDLNKHLAEYNKWKKDAFIKKACELLARMVWEVTYEDLEGNSVQHYDKMEFIEDFKKYMEDKI